jgi:shikimate dehydrogenase
MIYNLALLGHPVSHSKSPEIHTGFFREGGLKGGYICLDTLPKDLEKNIKSLQELGFKGVNLTIPHKQAGLKLVDYASEEAQLIGAANTLIFEDNGKIKAENTDWIGFQKAINDLQCIEQSNISRNALIIGAGGSARAILLTLLKMQFKQIGVLIRNTDSSKQNAQGLKLLFDKYFESQGISSSDCAFVIASLDEIDQNKTGLLFEQIDLIVNSTPVGMSGFDTKQASYDPSGEKQSPISERQINLITNTNCIFYDLIYNPIETEFLRLAKAKGFQTRNGYSMLYDQAAEAFKLWTGFQPKYFQL